MVGSRHLASHAAFAIAVFIGWTGVAHAQTAPVVFDGAGFITKAEGCNALDGFYPPVPTNFTFRPAFSISGAPEALELNFVGKAAALMTSTSSSGRLAGNSTFETTGISYFATPYGNDPKGGTSKLTITPKTVTQKTDYVTIAGTIKNLTGNPDCVLTITTALTRRP